MPKWGRSAGTAVTVSYAASGRSSGERERILPAGNGGFGAASHRSIYVAAAAVHHATVRLPATRGRGRRSAGFANRKCRELLFKLFGMALGTFRSLCAEKDSLKSVPTGLASILKNRHGHSNLWSAPRRTAATTETDSIIEAGA